MFWGGVFLGVKWWMNEETCFWTDKEKKDTALYAWLIPLFYFRKGGLREILSELILLYYTYAKWFAFGGAARWDLSPASSKKRDTEKSTGSMLTVIHQLDDKSRIRCSYGWRDMCITHPLGGYPPLWCPVHLASSPHLRIGHTSITPSQDNFLRQPSNVLTKKTMNSCLDHSHCKVQRQAKWRWLWVSVWSWFHPQHKDSENDN